MVPHSTKCNVPLLGVQCDNEEHSDVVFWVCTDTSVGSCGVTVAGAGPPSGERWRVPGHRSVLASASPVFAAMLKGPLAEGREVVIRDVEPRAFDMLIRHIYGETVELQSVETALSILYAAHKYDCEKLERHCLAYLNKNITISSVLVILHDVRLYYSTFVTSPSTSAPSAPSLDMINDGLSIAEGNEEACVDYTFCSHVKAGDIHQSCPANGSSIQQNSPDNHVNVPLRAENQYFSLACDMKRDYKCLMKQCLRFIDLNADEVLQREVFDELSHEEIISIVQRDTLGLSSEVVLFNALEKWGKNSCKRNCWELSPSNCRRALGEDLLFSVRYLLMSSEEFLNSPMKSNLLSSEECNFLLSHILKHSVVPSLPVMEKLLPVMGRSRKINYVLESPSRSLSSSFKEKISIKMNRNSTHFNSKPKNVLKKKKDPVKKESVKKEQNSDMLDLFFNCVSCIFD